MKQPNETKTPNPTGAKDRKKERQEIEENRIAPFGTMDDMDARAIIASYSGQTFDKMVYNIPFRDYKERAPKNCGIETCPHNGKKHHTHVVGIGINGINELVTLMGGIQIEVISTEIINKKGVPWYSAKAVAKDHFTLTERYGVGECKIGASRRGGSDDTRGDFDRLIAEHKAERNAAKKILPQLVLDGISKLALKGQTKFTEADIQTLFTPFWTTRKVLKDQWFEALTRAKLGVGGGAAGMAPQLPQNVSPVSNSDSINGAQKGAQAPETANTTGADGDKPTSPKQRGWIKRMLTDYGMEKNHADEFIDSKIPTTVEASDYIDEFRQGNFGEVEVWMEQMGYSMEKKDRPKKKSEKAENKSTKPDDQKDLDLELNE